MTNHKTILNRQSEQTTASDKTRHGSSTADLSGQRVGAGWSLVIGSSAAIGVLPGRLSFGTLAFARAIDIVLICLGTVLSLFALITLSLLLIIRWRNSRRPQSGVTKEYRSGQPSVLSNSLKNGAVTNVVVPAPSAAKPQKANANGTGQPDVKPADLSTDLAVGMLDKSAEINTDGEIHECRSSHSINRPHRPSKISLSPNLAKAAQVEAVQTEHSVDNFIEDLRRIRNGNDSVLYEEFQGYHSCSQFIATQGPIGPEEIGDGKKESTQRCSQYWPSLGETRWFGAIEVNLVSECEDPICIRRELNISLSTGSERRQALIIFHSC
ncbi:unnamed protein product [Angiostrongylus costaricensis]|uniref:Tyrosine-protein phosphatase domain-containing protein n=1 Tax=Angiostrongylus costaricensis TaxID=334426 RepID=A0A158PGQ2_ANGCS|nr:unnamed protein product [Angiostrongylus costaricensis]